MLAATVLAVSGEPSEQVTPCFRVKLAAVVVPDHLLARPDSIAPDDVKLISESYRKKSACSVTDSEVRSGSRLPGSAGRMTVAALPLAYCCDAVADAPPEAGLALPPALLAEPPLEQAATETAATDSAAAVVRILFRTFVLLEAGSMNS